MKHVAGQTRGVRTVFAWLAGMLMACAALPAARANIPAAERTALINLYNGANGAHWTASTNWTTSPGVFNSAGTECTWYGVSCDMTSSTVVIINLQDNALTGQLPALDGLTNLQEFNASSNGLNGPIPTLSGLANLASFNVTANQLTGPIPSLAGLAQLDLFAVDHNNLNGPIPSLSGLTKLTQFAAEDNQLSGQIPSLNGTNLRSFDVGYNNLNGPFPPLDGLANLQYLSLSGNAFTGPLPSTLPPSLFGFRIGDNAFTGTVPTAPGGLAANSSFLCPNLLTPASSPESSNDMAWDTAVGYPWSEDCAGVKASTTTITSISPALLTTGTTATVEFAVGGVTPLPNGNVTVADNVDSTAACGPVTIVNGLGNCTLIFASGETHTLTAEFQPVGNSTQLAAPSSGTSSVSVSAITLAAPTITLSFNPASVALGGTSTLTATLSNPNSVPLQLNTADVTITGLPGDATLIVPGSNPTVNCGGNITGFPVVIPAQSGSTPGTCMLTFTNVSAGSTPGPYTAKWPLGVQFITTNGQVAINLTVTTTTTSMATLTVTSSGGAGGGGFATAPVLTAWALVLLGLLLAVIGFARRSPG